MNSSFKFTATPSIYFGVKKIKMLPQLVQQFGQKALVVTGKSSFLKTFEAMELFQDLEAYSVETKIVHIKGEPSPEEIDTAILTFKKWKPNVVVAIGGGSVMDAGKAISAMLCEKGLVKSFLEDVGTQLPSGNKVPLITVPTTAGTGSEATKNAVITQTGEHSFKKSLRHTNYVPNIALVDPELTIGCPPSITAATGMDAFTQLLESYLSTNSNPMTNALALDGMKRLIRSIEKAYNQGNHIDARTDMSYAAMISGITLANAGLGVVHGFAQPLGSLFGVPHGVVCGTLMGAVNRITVQRLREENNKITLAKYDQVAKLISNAKDESERIDEFINELDRLTIALNLPVLSEFGIKANDFSTIVSQTGLKYHPVELNDHDLTTILSSRL